MKRSKGLFGFVFLLLGMVSAVPATATATSLGTANWAWEGAGTGFVYDLQIFSTLSSANSFSLTSLDGSKSLGLVQSGILGGLLNVTENVTNNSYEASVTPVPVFPPVPDLAPAAAFRVATPAPAGVPAPINLGSEPQFRFLFSDGSRNYSTYETILVRNNSYILNNKDTGMAISFQSSAATTATPIPGAALLFGSGLLGLLGINRRKNKA